MRGAKVFLIICLVIIAGLIFVLWKKAYAPINDADEYLEYYMNQIVPVETGMIEYINREFYRRGLSMSKYKDFSATHYDCMNCYDSLSDKYFRVYLFDAELSLSVKFTTDFSSGKSYCFYVNKKDLSNPIYGTEVNPIPVFNSREILRKKGASSDNSELKYSDMLFDQKQYEQNILAYLTYVMSEDEFKRKL